MTHDSTRYFEPNYLVASPDAKRDFGFDTHNVVVGKLAETLDAPKKPKISMARLCWGPQLPNLREFGALE